MSESAVVAVAELDDEGWGLIEATVHGLEESWRTTPCPELSQLLPSVAAPLQRRLLVELIKVDQEKRWECGKNKDIETYLREFDELNQDPQTVVELVEAECLTRAAFDDPPDRAEIQSRFPTIHDRIDLQSIIKTAAEERRKSKASGSPPVKSELDTADLSNDQTDWSIGSTPQFSKGARLGRYEIREVIGRGGMATVYRAYDGRLQRDVALKIPHGGLLVDPQAVERFIREAQSSAAIRHPNVCPTFDAGQIDGTPYISMAIIEGRPLTEVIEEQELTPREFATIVRKLADALQHAHDAGLVHRDIKPSNVIIDQRGEPLLTDFGLARQLDADENLTSTGSILGTPAYMSPEQVRGETSAINASTDVYGLGVVLYQLLAGRAPFSSRMPTLLVEIENATPPAPQTLNPNIDSRLATICMKAMAKCQDDRYASMHELSDDLQDYLQQPQPVGSVPPINVRRVIQLGLAAAAVVLLGVIIYLSTDNGQLVVQSDVNDLRVTVTQNNEEVDSFTVTTVGKTVRLRSGQYEISLDRESGDAITIDNEHVTVSRGGRAVVRIQRRRTVHSGLSTNVRAITPESPTFQSSPLDALRREDIDPYELSVAGGGDPAKAPAELVAIFGDSRLQQWEPVSHASAFFGAGNTLISYGGSRIYFWDAATGKQIRSIEESSLNAIAISPDRRTLIVGRDHRFVDFWSVETGLRLRTLDHIYLGHRTQWSPDGSLLVSNQGNDVVIWSVETGERLKTLEGHKQSIESLAVSANSRLVASGSADEAVRIWDVATGEEICQLTDTGVMELAMAFSPDGKQLLTGSNGKMHFWDVATGELTRSLNVGSLSVIKFTPDGTKVVVSTIYEKWGTRVIDVETGKTLLDIRPWHVIDVSPDGKKMLANKGFGVRVFDMSSGECLTEKGPHSMVRPCMAISPDGRKIATGCFDGTTKLWDLTRSQASHLLSKFSGDLRQVEDVAFSPDGTLIAGVNGGPEIIFWDVATGKELARLNDIQSRVHSLTFFPKVEPDGDKLTLPEGIVRRTHPVVWLASGDNSGNVNLSRIVRGEDTVTGEETLRHELIQTFAGHDKAVHRLAFTRDGALLASNSEIKVIVWDVKSGEARQTFPVQGSEWGLLAFSYDGNLLARGYEGVSVWDVNTGERVRNFRGHARNANGVAFSPDGHYLGSDADNGTVRIARINPQPDESILVKRFVLGPSGGHIGRVYFDSTGRYLINLNGNGTVYVMRLDGLDMTSKAPPISVPEPTVESKPDEARPPVEETDLDDLKREDIDPYELAVAGGGDPAKAPPELVSILGDSRLHHWNPLFFVGFSADGKTLITADRECDVVFWDAESGDEIRRLRFEHLCGVAISENRKTLVTGNYGGSVDFWDAKSGGHLRTLESVHFSDHVAWSPDGKLFATSRGNVDVVVWSASTGESVHVLKGHSNPIESVAFGPNSKLVASASGDKTARIWNALTGESIHVFDGFKAAVDSVAFTPDGQQLLVGSHGDPLKFFDVQTGTLVRELDVGIITHIAFSPDQKKIALGGLHGSRSYVVDAESGEVLFGVDASTVVAFSPDGQKLALATHSRIGIRIFDANNGDLLLGKGPHGDTCYCMAMSPDGKTLATGCQDGTTKLWDVMSGQEERLFKGSATAVKDAAFSPDGTTIASIEGGGILHLWDVGTGVLLCELRNGFVPNSGAPESIAFHPRLAGLASTDAALPVGISRRTHPIAILAVGTNAGKVILTRVVRGEDDITGEPTARIQPIRTLNGHDHDVRDVKFSADGHSLVSSEGSPDNKVNVWDVDSGELLRSFEAEEVSGRVAISPDGKMVATGVWTGRYLALRLWDVTMHRAATDYRGHLHAIYGVAFSPDGQYVASAGTDGTVRISRVNPGDGESVLVKRFVLGPQFGYIYAVMFDHTGRYLFTLNANGTIYILRLDEQDNATSDSEADLVPETLDKSSRRESSGPAVGTAFDDLKREEIDSYELAAAGGGDPNNAPEKLVAVFGNSRMSHWSQCVDKAFSADGKELISIGADGVIAVWDVATGSQLRRITCDGEIRTAAFSWDRSKVLTGTREGRVTQLWDLSTGELLRTFPKVVLGAWTAVDQSGSLVFTERGNTETGIINLDTQTIVREFKGDEGQINGVAFSPDGRLVASADNHQTVRLWDVVTGKQVHIFSGPDQGATRIAFGPQGDQLGITFGTLFQLWNVERKEKLFEAEVPYDAGLAFNSDGTKVAYASRSAAGVIDTEAHTIVLTIAGGGPVCFSPDGNRLSYNVGNSIRICDAATGKDLLAPNFLGAPTWERRPMAVSPDCSLIAVSGGETGELILCNISRGHVLRRLYADAGQVFAVEFIGDGRLLASVSAEAVKIWEVGTGREMGSLDGPYVDSADVDPVGNVVAIGKSSGSIELWTVAVVEDEETGEDVARFTDLCRIAAFSNDAVISVAFNSNGTKIIGGCRNKTAKLWDVENGTLLSTFAGHDHWVDQVAISPDGKYVATHESFGMGCIVDRGRNSTTLAASFSQFTGCDLQRTGR